MINLLHEDTFDNYKINILKELIKTHNSEYLRLFKDNLKPKFHILTHYPSIILQSGPPKQYNCFRFEAKHRDLKQYARSTNCRINPMLSLSKKAQFKFANYLITPIRNPLGSCQSAQISSLHQDYISNKLNLTSNQFQSYKEILWHGTKYHIDDFLHKLVDGSISFFKIMEIIISENSIYFVCTSGFETVFLEHFQAYNLLNNSNTILSIESIEQFTNPPIQLYTLQNKNKMLKLTNNF